MINSTFNRRKPGGYVSYLVVLTMGIVLLTMLLSTYKSSVTAQESQARATVRTDLASKEDEILRGIVNITPNRAIRAMMDRADSGSMSRQPLRWRAIFADAIAQANVEESVSADMLDAMGISGTVSGNAGDASYADISKIIDAIEPESGYVSPGVGRSLGLGFPPPLESDNSGLISNDRVYPIISHEKYYGPLAATDVSLSVDEYPNYNLIPFPDIRFAYVDPGDLFVAKRNWWAFSLDLADAHDDVTGLERFERDFILSIYEIPSQLAISAEAAAVIGQYADGTQWDTNVTVDGKIYVRAGRVEEGLTLAGISGRRSIELGENVAIGDYTAGGDPFAMGTREQFELAYDEFLPISLSSEAGRSAFLPINRGTDFYDRYAHEAESQTLSPTSWNEYSVGALQCAMRLDITDCASDSDNTPTELRFEYMEDGERKSMEIDLDSSGVSGLPAGYIRCATEGDVVNFPHPVDVAYGADGSYYFEENVTGNVTFDDARFGDPSPGSTKSGYYRPSYPFDVKLLRETKWVVEVYPERFEAFLDLLNADSLDVNNSLAVNVDYVGNDRLVEPSMPCTDEDYGVVLRECADLSSFDTGFSLVTNLRLYLAENYNTVSVTPPTGSGIPEPFYPPSSIFAPEKRLGADVNPFAFELEGSIGSITTESGDEEEVNLLEVKHAGNTAMDHNRVSVNLTQIKHPAALPPITMTNWLIVLEERRREFYTAAD